MDIKGLNNDISGNLCVCSFGLKQPPQLPLLYVNNRCLHYGCLFQEYSDETQNIFWKKEKALFSYLQRPVYLIFVKYEPPLLHFIFERYIYNVNSEHALGIITNLWCYGSFSSFIKFLSTENNTVNAMSDLYFNEESNYSDENTNDNKASFFSYFSLSLSC